MADQDKPNKNANKSKAEGERLNDEGMNRVRNADPDAHPERLYDTPVSEDAGGITNRPLSDEIENQESLPERGTTKHQKRETGGREEQTDPALPSDDATLNTKI